MMYLHNDKELFKDVYLINNHLHHCILFLILIVEQINMIL